MKRQSKPKLKGTVLFTVISVMSLLIIFLTSTLVLAASASNRTHRNYASSQTEYTARAAIESFSEAMARNDGIAQMIVNMKKTDVLTPSVDINDASLGEIGYYKNDGTWVPGQISIEYIDDTYVYNTKNNSWEEQQVLKITATAELGGEESTVSAYIRKKSPDEPSPLSIKGLHTVGGLDPDTTKGTYTGALALGITADGSQTYQLNNGTDVETDLTFVNGSLNSAGNVNIHVLKPQTGTVVMGNLHVSNSNFISIDYEMPDDFIQKDIPYLYVDGSVSCDSSLNIKNVNGKNAPYNIFCGSWNTWDKEVKIDNSDLYLMDTGATSRIGGSAGNTRLSAWNNALHQKSETQFDSKGGNIYSKGNLELKQTEIFGDVRCEGNATIDSGVTIHGNLVVGGTLNLNSSFTVDKSIYADNYNGFTAKLKSGYKKIEKNNVHHAPYNSIDPKYNKVDNIKYDYETNNYEVYDSDTPDPSGNGNWIDRDGNSRRSKVTYYDESGNCYEENQWYQYYMNGFENHFFFNGDEVARGYLKDKFGNIYHHDQWNPTKYDNGYYVTADQFGNEIGTEPTNKEYYYYDTTDASYPPVEVDEHTIQIHNPPYWTQRNCDGDDNNPNSGTDSGIVVTDHKTIYYKNSSGALVSASEAYTGVLPVSDFINSKGSIYPDNMTREAITGYAGTNPYPDGNQEYKIITSLKEIQEDVGYKSGAFDPSVYLTSVPSGVVLSKEYDSSSFVGSNTLNITENCKINGDIGNNRTIYIRPTGTLWVELNDVTLNHGSKIVVDDSHGSVNFMINGTLTLYNSLIVTKAIDDGNLSINESDKIGITFYGANTSQIAYNNNDTICGTAKCPYTRLNITNDGGRLSGVTYNGSSVPNPHWIGNALFSEIGNSGDNFTLLYTDAGGSSEESIMNQLLSESWAVMYYDVY